MKYNYLEHMVDCIDSYMRNHYNVNNVESLPCIADLVNELDQEDSIIGNKRGSFTLNRQKASDCLSGNFDYLDMMLDCGFINFKESCRHSNNPEWFDVQIRSFLLSGALMEWCNRNEIQLKD